jgi:hypothetical protein
MEEMKNCGGECVVVTVSPAFRLFLPSSSMGKEVFL